MDQALESELYLPAWTPCGDAAPGRDGSASGSQLESPAGEKDSWHRGAAEEAYGDWDAADLVVSDGAYGVGGLFR